MQIFSILAIAGLAAAAPSVQKAREALPILDVLGGATGGIGGATGGSGGSPLDTATGLLGGATGGLGGATGGIGGATGGSGGSPLDTVTGALGGSGGLGGATGGLGGLLDPVLGLLGGLGEDGEVSTDVGEVAAGGTGPLAGIGSSNAGKSDLGAMILNKGLVPISKIIGKLSGPDVVGVWGGNDVFHGLDSVANLLKVKEECIKRDGKAGVGNTALRAGNFFTLGSLQGVVNAVNQITGCVPEQATNLIDNAAGGDGQSITKDLLPSCTQYQRRLAGLVYDAATEAAYDKLYKECKAPAETKAPAA